jgi:predicted RNA methylase
MKNHRKYVERITQELESKKKHNKTTIEKIASSFGITNKNLIKELTELAIVNLARKYAHNPKLSIIQRYEAIVQLYKSQVNLSHRTSESMRLQQYSTPAPIGYIAGVFCGMNNPPKSYYYFEPSAGNGLLTIAAKPEHFIVNEIDDVRHKNLLTQGYDSVLQCDASKSFEKDHFVYDAVITNPPFGTLIERERVGNFTTKVLDHKMAAIALQTMKHSGKAAIIIGGHTKWDERGRIQKGKNRDFFLWLYHNYYVMDVINIDGHKLYSRQGTAFDTRLILINGRKIKPEGFPPLKRVTDVVEDDFAGLYKRVMQYVNDVPTKGDDSLQREKRIRIAKSKAKAKIKLLELLKK